MMSRRRFCMALGAYFGSSICRSNVGWSSPAGDVWERSSKGFGTTVQVQVRHESAVQARKAIDNAFHELERVESLMSIYRPDSQVSRLNRHRRLQAPDPLLVHVLQQAESFSRQTASAFDITVQPLWELYKSRADADREPNEQEVRSACLRVGHHHVVIQDHHVRLQHDAEITLNGIAQGFAADRVKQVLRAHGVQHALVDMGELAGLGQGAGGQPWQVGVQHPRQQAAYAAVIPLDRRCLATSGDYQTSFTEDFRAHHIFNPSTGHSPTELASVSVLAPTAIAADALSTALLVTGLRRGDELLSKWKEVDALFVRKDGRTFATAGFPRSTT